MQRSTRFSPAAVREEARREVGGADAAHAAAMKQLHSERAKAVRTKATRGDSGAIGAAVSGVVGAAASLAIVVVGAAVSQVAAHVFRHCATPPEGAPGEIWGRSMADIGEI